MRRMRTIDIQLTGLQEPECVVGFWRVADSV